MTQSTAHSHRPGFWSIVLEPVRALSDQKLRYFGWLAGLVVFGLAGIWLPVLLELVRGNTGQANGYFLRSLYTGAVASFGIAILADNLTALLRMPQSKDSVIGAGIRGLLGVWGFTLFVIWVAVMMADYGDQDAPHISVWFYVVLLVLSILTVAYLYCFRDPDLAGRFRTVEEEKEAEDREVEKLAESAKAQAMAEEVKL